MSHRLTAVVLLALALGAAPASAQEHGEQAARERREAVPAEMQDVGITERLGARLPLDLRFTESDGREVALRDFFDGERPVILNLVYYNCPMLCNLILDGMIAGLEDVDWTPGQEFTIVTVSIDSSETVAAATTKKAHLIESYGRPSAAAGWHFLTGEGPAIRALADGVGFKFKWNEKRTEIIHAAAIYIVTPDGAVSRYLHGVMFDPKTIKLSLVEAAGGKIGGPVEHALLFCFRYDPDQGRYALAALNLMRLGGALTALILLGTVGGFLLRDRRRRLAGEAKTS